MRWLTKMTILGLAGYGAARLYQRVEPRIATITSRRDSIRSAAGRVAGKVESSVRDVADETRDATRDVSRDLVDGGPPTSGRLPVDAPARALP